MFNEPDVVPEKESFVERQYIFTPIMRAFVLLSIPIT